MKKIQLLILFLFFANAAATAQVVVAPGSPYNENFDTCPGPFPSASCSGWTVTGVTGVPGFGGEPVGPWELGTPLAGPTAGDTDIVGSSSAPNAWEVNLDGIYGNNAEIRLNSPSFDFSALAAGDQAIFSADIFLSCEGNWDGARIDFSTDGGVTWNTLGTSPDPIGVNWYNDAVIVGSGEPGWTGDPGTGWVSVSRSLDGSGGVADYRIRFSFDSDGVVQGEGFGVDNISIFVDPDITAQDIVLPTPGTLSASEPVQVQVTNTGSFTITDVTVNYNVSGALTYTSTQSETGLSIAPGATFTLPAFALDFSTEGSYIVEAVVTTPGDANPSNNTVEGIATHIPTILSLPYFENFDNDPGGWAPIAELPVGAATGWEWGTPTTPVINSAFSAPNAWVTNLDGLYEQDARYILYSPIFDLSDETSNAFLSFRLNNHTRDFWDGTRIDFTTDGGATWNILGAFADPDAVNWYNQNVVNASGQAGWDDIDEIAPWSLAARELTGSAGVANYQFRFVFESSFIAPFNQEGTGVDDIAVFGADDLDLAVNALTSPTSGSGLIPEEFLNVEIQNLAAEVNIPFSINYTITGPTGEQTTDEIVTTTFGLGAVGNYIFTSPATFAVAGTYNVQVAISLPGDLNTSNDTLNALVIHSPVTNPVVCLVDEDFETTTAVTIVGGGVIINPTPPTNWDNVDDSGAGALWIFDDGTLLGAAYADVPNAPIAGNYALMPSDLYGALAAPHQSSLVSPTLDLSSFGTGSRLSLSFNSDFINTFDATTGNSEAQVQVSDDGGASWTTLEPVSAENNNVPNQTDFLTAGFPNPAAEVSFDLTSYLGTTSNFITRFNIVGNDGGLWALDNVSLCFSDVLPVLEAETNNIDTIFTTWTDSSSVESGFLLTRTTDPALATGWEVIAYLPANTTSFRDPNVIAGVNYCYRVQYIYNDMNVSDFSNIGCAEIVLEGEGVEIPPYVANLTAEPGHQEVYLTWTAPIPAHNIVAFEVFGFSPNPPTLPTTRVGTTGEYNFTVTGLYNGTEYGFRIRPIIDQAGDGVPPAFGEYSEVAVATPSIILGNDELTSDMDITVYPNPNNGQFTLNIQGKAAKELNISVVSVAGQTVYVSETTTFDGQLNEQLDLSTLPSGLYIINVKTEDHVYRTKVTINR